MKGRRPSRGPRGKDFRIQQTGAETCKKSLILVGPVLPDAVLFFDGHQINIPGRVFEYTNNSYSVEQTALDGEAQAKVLA